MRLIRLLLALAFVALGAVLGALNRTPVALDFAALTVTIPVGVALLCALLIGLVVGGIAVTAGVVIPLRRRLARSERAAPPATTTQGR